MLNEAGVMWPSSSLQLAFILNFTLLRTGSACLTRGLFLKEETLIGKKILYKFNTGEQK